MAPLADQRSRAEELFQQPWSREVLVDEDGAYVARVPELPGCFADGDSLQEALENLDVVLREWLTISLERGNPVPTPRRIADSFSGRFSVRVPRSLHEALSRRAEDEDCSLNQLVTFLLAEAVRSPHLPETGGSPDSADISEGIAADAVRSGSQAIAALKGIGTLLRDRGEVAAREFGMAASLARREKRHKLAESLLRESVQRDPTNLRSSSTLGQLLYWQGHYPEAIAYLARASSIDNYARLFLGWSYLLEGVNLSDEVQKREGSDNLDRALREWCYQNGDRASRASWLRQVQRLAKLGGGYIDEAKHLVDFANANANWGPIDPDVVTVLESDDDISAPMDELHLPALR